MDKKYVWYACYGSNLLKERFMCYIKGGTCRLNGRKYDGCSDASDPVDDRPITIHHELYFGNSSAAWENGGVAFLKPERDEKAIVFGRMYRITEEQFYEVQKQEGLTWYGRMLSLGEFEASEILTFTHGTIFDKKEPGPKYIEVIRNGLKETYPEMSSESINKYITSWI